MVDNTNEHTYLQFELVLDDYQAYSVPFELIRFDTDFQIDLCGLEHIVRFFVLCRKLRFIRGRVSDPILLAGCFLRMNVPLKRALNGEVVSNSLHFTMQQYRLYILRTVCVFIGYV
jgi:hypothetical protein